MTSAILDSIHQPASAIIHSVALYPKVDDFCRELAIRALADDSVIATAIVYSNLSAQLQVVGKYGSQDVLETIPALRHEIDTATREKNFESLRIACTETESEVKVTVALVPATPLALSSGVLVIFLNCEVDDVALDHDTQVALAFAVEMYCSPSWAAVTLFGSRAKRNTLEESGPIQLTSRQKQIIEMIAEGRTNDRIARALNYSLATVKNDISAIFQFLGVNNRHDATIQAQKGHLVPLPDLDLGD